VNKERLGQRLAKRPDLAKRLDRVLGEMVHAALWPKSDVPGENAKRIAELKEIYRCLGYERKKTTD
jgi:hypothetical protein